MNNSDQNSVQKKIPREAYALFTLVVIGAALGNLSQTGLNAMLSATMADFGVGVELGQWLATGYMLMMGVAVPVATFLTKKLDERTYIMLGFGLFAAGSLIDWVTPEFFTMLLGRILQAIAVGLLAPMLQTISMTKFPPGRQATAMGVAGIALGFAPNVGPTVGGMMDSLFGWRSFFLLLFVLTAVLCVLSLFLVKPHPEQRQKAQFETISFIFSTLGFGGVLLGLSQASSYGMRSLWVWVPIAVGAVFVALFLRRQSKVEEPLIDLRIFRCKAFNWGMLASVFLFACFMGVTLIIPLYVEGVLGGTSLDAGLVILPTTITALLVNPLSGILSDKVSPRFTCLLFGSFFAVGSIACCFIGEDTPLWLLSLWHTTRAIGVSGLIGPLVTYALTGLDKPLVPHGSTAQVVTRQLAATFSTAIMVFIVVAVTPLVEAWQASAALPYQASFAFSALMGVLCFVTIFLRVK